jgi:thiol-disulfide isomerase/thioredoxin
MRMFALAVCALAVAACSPARETRAAAQSTAATMPIPRGGAELIGKGLGDLQFDGWIGEPLPLQRGSGATVVRWWTEGCPFCEQSLPALDGLRRAYEGRGLRVIGVYHQKSEVALSDAEVASAAEARHFEGSVALDREWRALDRAWPAAMRPATSVTLLLDADGVVRFTHPGTELHPSSDPAHAQCAADYADLERSVALLLAAPSATH